MSLGFFCGFRSILIQCVQSVSTHFYLSRSHFDHIRLPFLQVGLRNLAFMTQFNWYSSQPLYIKLFSLLHGWTRNFSVDHRMIHPVMCGCLRLLWEGRIERFSFRHRHRFPLDSGHYLVRFCNVSHGIDVELTPRATNLKNCRLLFRTRANG